jgi:hypothetical protein
MLAIKLAALSVAELGLTLGHSFLGECVGIKLGSFKLGLFVGTLLGPEDAGNQVCSFVGGEVMGLTVGNLLVEECVGIKLGLFIGSWAWKMSVIKSAALSVTE